MSAAPPPPRPHRRRKRSGWLFFFLAFAASLALVGASSLVRLNQYSPLTLTTLRPGEQVEMAGWRFSVNRPLSPAGSPGSFSGPGLDSGGGRLDQEGTTWLYAEILAEPLPGTDVEHSSCSLEVRAGSDWWETQMMIDQRAPTNCIHPEFTGRVGAPGRVGSYFQLPTHRLEDDPYLVVIVPGFPARALVVAGS